MILLRSLIPIIRSYVNYMVYVSSDFKTLGCWNDFIIHIYICLETFFNKFNRWANHMTNIGYNKTK